MSKTKTVKWTDDGGCLHLKDESGNVLVEIYKGPRFEYDANGVEGWGRTLRDAQRRALSSLRDQGVEVRIEPALCSHWWWIVPDEHVFCSLEEGHDGHHEQESTESKATQDEISLARESGFATRGFTRRADELASLRGRVFTR